ncbi:hypothetical protein [Exiguobacterium antarcticum]|uniref:hypothetical protein n=1 Tax=Exiguobacterium antarcticum TaxID=132920 RepID=UPI00047CE148|nr:hypothetical protein [Exiguobacterium antarcticum]
MTRELILKRYERGMTVEQIAAADNLTLDSVQAIVDASNVTPIKRDVNHRKSVLITDDEIMRRLRDGETRHVIEKDFDLTPGTLSGRVKRIKQDMKNNKPPVKRGRRPRVTDEMLVQMVREGKTRQELRTELKTTYVALDKRLDALGLKEVFETSQEVAVTTESDGFADNYTIAHMTKEEEQMTEAIAEVKQEERNEPNDKWVHFVANQIEHAKVKTKFDVVQEGKKFIERTEVRFVIEEELA